MKWVLISIIAVFMFAYLAVGVLITWHMTLGEAGFWECLKKAPFWPVIFLL